MILRKPYAFLMKHFRKINLVLLLLSVYIFMQTVSLLTFTLEYANANTNVVDSILVILSSSYFLIIILIIAITMLLLYLLKRKDKPIKTYVVVLLEYLILLFLSIYLKSYFGDFLINGYDRAVARTIHGFVFIFSLPQYLILLLLVIRTIGLDLNSFGFKHDQELLSTEEDREEVEVEVGFDKDKFFRNVKKVLRNIKYFVLEHKAQVLLITSVIVVIISIFTYRYFYVENKVYKMNQDVSSNYYTFNIQNSYITTRDYKGDIVNKNKSYVIIDLDVKNDIPTVRTLDIGKFILYVDDDYYVPTVNYNNYFSDLGPVFKDQRLPGNDSANYFLIYEIDTPKENSNFILNYQDVTNNARLIKVKLQIKDISSFVLKDTKNLTENINFPINETDVMKFNISSYEIGTNFLYTYESCRLNDCPVYTDYTNLNSDRLVIYMKVNPLGSNMQILLNNILKYGKIRYTINNQQYTESLKNAISKSYSGNYLYINVSSQVMNATDIEMVFTIRNNQYVYKIK